MTKSSALLGLLKDQIELQLPPGTCFFLIIASDEVQYVGDISWRSAHNLLLISLLDVGKKLEAEITSNGGAT